MGKISADFGDSEFDASASALRFVRGSGIELTRGIRTRFQQLISGW